MFSVPLLPFVAAPAPSRLMSMGPIDIAIVAIYFALVLAIGFYLKRYAKTGEDFFMPGRDMSAWIGGLAFIGANLGSLEMMGQHHPRVAEPGGDDGGDGGRQLGNEAEAPERTRRTGLRDDAVAKAW